MLGPEILTLSTTRLALGPTEDEEAYRQAMKRSHRELEPSIYPATLDFRFHPGKVLLDIRSRESAERIGGFSLHDFDDENQSCELGYWILPEYQGQGLMREGADKLLGSLFEKAGMKRVHLVCDRRNARSIALARRLGFQHEAFLQGVDVVTGEAVTKFVFARYPT